MVRLTRPAITREDKMVGEKESAEDREKRKGTKILVLDDDRSIREVLRELLVGEGYIVKMAQNGKEALEWITKETFDLVLTDLGMPEMDGIQLLKTLQRIAPDMRVIVVTGRADLEARARVKSPWVHDYVTKPFHPYTILEKVSRALAKKTDKLGGNDNG